MKNLFYNITIFLGKSTFSELDRESIAGENT